MKIKQLLLQCILFSASLGHGMELSSPDPLAKIFNGITYWTESILNWNMSRLTINDSNAQPVEESTTVDEPTINESPLIIAIEDGDLNKVKELCTQENVNELYLDEPPLAYALQSHQWDVARYLIKQNANTCFTYNGQNPLHIAAENCKLRLINRLLETQLRYWVNITDARGDTPLTLCAPCLIEKDKKIALNLIDHGASILTMCPDFGLGFIEKMADLDDNYAFAFQCFWHACCYALKNRLDAQLNELLWYVKAIIPEEGINTADKEGNTFLHKVVNFSCSPNKINYFIGLLLTYGANPQQKNKVGESPLDIVAKQRNHVLTLFLRAHR